VTLLVRPRAVIVLGAAWLVARSVIAQGQCVEFKDPKERFDRSDAVFVGTVIAIEPTGIEGTHVNVAIATFRMEKSWKGTRKREVTVGTDVAFEVGRRYVVFSAGTPLSTTVLCRWSEPAENARATLAWLASKPSRSPR